jgi:hypothetical protein
VKAQTAKGGLLGARASLASRTTAKGTLPFTGMPLWPAAALGAMFLLGGLYLRRRGGVH